MKKVIVALSTFLSFNYVGQNEVNDKNTVDKKIGFGFHLGLTKSFIQLNEKENTLNFNTKSKLSYRMGSEMNIKLNKALEIHTSISLLFITNNIS